MFFTAFTVRSVSHRFDMFAVCSALSLAAALPGALAQSSPSIGSQTVVADSENNGLRLPGAVAVSPNGNVFIADTGNNRVVEEAWNASTRAYSAQTIVVTDLASPGGIALGANGTVFVADTGNNRVVELPWNKSTGVYGPAKTVGSDLNNPTGVAVAPNGSVYIADTGNGRVVEVPWDRSTGAYGPQTTAGVDLVSPEAVAFANDKLYIANAGNNTVVEVAAGCDALKSCTTQTMVADQSKNDLSSPNSLAVSANGNLYLTQQNSNQALELPWSRATAAYGKQIAIGNDLNGPRGVAADANGTLFIADSLNNRVLKISQSQPHAPSQGRGRRGGMGGSFPSQQ
jgi:glucose/arabinose dehydrogenase